MKRCKDRTEELFGDFAPHGTPYLLPFFLNYVADSKQIPVRNLAFRFQTDKLGGYQT